MTLEPSIEPTNSFLYIQYGNTEYIDNNGE